jgi:acyl-CoA synthetase (AMP-forming)/AMP-acid ligase II
LDYPNVPIWWILEKNIEKFADRTAIRFVDHESLIERQVLTYKSLVGMARSVAAGLQRLGIKTGDRIALYLPNCPELIVSYFAIWRAGGVAVPCNPMFRREELAHQLRDAEVSCGFTTEKGREIESGVSNKICNGLCIW